MRMPYRTLPDDKESMQRAQQIVSLIVGWGVTYREAEDALTVAQELLQTKTKLVTT